MRDKTGFAALQEKVTNRLEGLKVAAYYGCLLLRPKEVAIDNVEDPRVMEGFISAVGAEPLQYPYRTECCGVYVFNTTA